MIHNAQFKQFEFVILFTIIPLLFVLHMIPLGFLMPMLWLMSLYAMLVLKATHHDFSFLGFKKNQFIFTLLRFILLGAVFTFLSYFYHPEAFFHMVKNEMQLFILLLLLYPLISVLPQELLYREFFFSRYHWKLSVQNQIMLNAVIFSWAHSAFDSIIVFALTLFVGLLFAQTYLRNRSFILVCIEHTLFGYLLFTSGMGELFFQSGSLDLLRSITG
ncbi:type II CAAX prenyl endopeptidase Rce1 family protein [Candidatus Marinarcus aquaticus]|uniref:CAAX prenyl protease 2/Lysostaphin resistance protein A-like domain-containing protein n=1 Tax=Candidatus Marinarcus aquaticus TaxID=2044504 RepID=A0A4Q0XXJ0_9BACT|nr:CPBP family glutamic-type intramembrane protease [Candidatus Marinarcus aquaticus]RXJ60691.1 hypothetical protein CRV04_01375 [Candidatus Marinarcus aquaticus]